MPTTRMPSADEFYFSDFYFEYIMGDSWEDWDDDAVAVPAPAVAIVGQQEEDKFADEDIEEEEPKWKGSVPEPQQVSWKRDVLPWLLSPDTGCIVAAC